MVQPRSILFPISCDALSDCCLLLRVSSVGAGKTKGGLGGGETSVGGVDARLITSPSLADETESLSATSSGGGLFVRPLRRHDFGWLTSFWLFAIEATQLTFSRWVFWTSDAWH